MGSVGGPEGSCAWITLVSPNFNFAFHSIQIFMINFMIFHLVWLKYIYMRMVTHVIFVFRWNAVVINFTFVTISAFVLLSYFKCIGVPGMLASEYIVMILLIVRSLTSFAAFPSNVYLYYSILCDTTGGTVVYRHLFLYFFLCSLTLQI